MKSVVMCTAQNANIVLSKVKVSDIVYRLQADLAMLTVVREVSNIMSN